MGGKRSWKRKHLHICIAVLILLFPLGCAFDHLMRTKMVDASGEEARAHLALGRRFLTEGNFAGALMENEKVLFLAGRNTPVDEALFAIAMIHAHVDNPAKNQKQSLMILGELIKNYPGSPLVQQAKIIRDLLDDNDIFSRRVERLNHIIDERQKTIAGSDAKVAEKQKIEDQAKTIVILTQENEKLNRNIEKLNTIIDELKKVDIDVDQKKREKGK